MSFRKLAPAGVVAAIAAALALAGTTIAAAAGSASARPAAAVRQVSAASLCQSPWAVVSNGGVLTRAGCPGTTSAEDGTGFMVTFPRNVANCAYLANVGRGDAGLQPPAGMAATTLRAPGQVDTVFVQTYDATGATTHQSFHLAVDCAPLTRSGRVKISAPHRSVTIVVPHGLSSSSVALATAQNNVGVSVLSAVPDPQAGRITIHLSRAPRHGKPVIVGWSVVN